MPTASTSDIFKILTVAPNLIQIEVLDATEFKQTAHSFTIGSYLKISDEDDASIIALVQSYKIKEPTVPVLTQENDSHTIQPTSFILDAQPIGFLDKDGKFKRGGQQIAIPPNNVEIASVDLLKGIYNCVEDSKKFVFSTLAQNQSVEVAVDGDLFFSKHIAIFGSTGSGKSGTVAKILQEGMKPSEGQQKSAMLNNSHILLFDLHGEYNPAFPNARTINIDNMVLPYWLMNAEELEELFIESNESNSHNQLSQFKAAVTLNKKRHNKTLPKVNYDTPVYFSINEVFKYISNQNAATKDAKTGEIKIKSPIPGVDSKHQLFEEIEFEEKSSGKINGGAYNGEFERFIPRLETKINDNRLAFLFSPSKADGSEYKTADLEQILHQFICYADTKTVNISIIDLSGIPFEVLSVVVSLISRMIFDFCFYYKTIKTPTSEVPFLIVLEEAHNYIPQNDAAKYQSVKKSIERIAKEGRKYGLSLMIVSQRPSEISETIFSQCSNFVAMRLTNPSDQQYVKRLLPDNVSTITDTLPVLERQEAIIIGDSIAVPSIVRIDDITEKPNSNDIAFRTEWKKDWCQIAFDTMIKKMTKAE